MTLEIVAAQGRRGVAAFVDVPWQLPPLAGSPTWVPPLRMMVRDNLDTSGNPFYKSADRALFIARRNGRAVGRIAAIENRAHNRYHEDRVGFFGFFECEDNAETAARLFESAADWLKGKGLAAMRGPMSPSTNHECGLLVDGFDVHPMFLTPWNPRYYEALVTGAGLAQVKELLAYWLPYGEPGFQLNPRLAALAERAKSKSKLAFRSIRLDTYMEDVAICWDVYNGAWEKNWGFVPMSREEFFHMARELKPLLIPQFAFIAEVNGAPAGFMLCVPDFNLVFKKNPTGRLIPFGLYHILTGKSKLRTGRLMALGIKEEFRTGSILPVFMHEAAQRGMAYGSTGAEASWILEDNQAVRQPAEGFGGRVYRRWRIYEKPL